MDVDGRMRQGADLCNLAEVLGGAGRRKATLLLQHVEHIAPANVLEREAPCLPRLPRVEHLDDEGRPRHQLLHGMRRENAR